MRQMQPWRIVRQCQTSIFFQSSFNHLSIIFQSSFDLLLTSFDFVRLRSTSFDLLSIFFRSSFDLLLSPPSSDGCIFSFTEFNLHIHHLLCFQCYSICVVVVSMVSVSVSKGFLFNVPIGRSQVRHEKDRVGRNGNNRCMCGRC
jgi:hypothetical protein